MNTQKRIHHFKAGDIVHFHGARFRILDDARESHGHWPQSAHLTRAAGPSDVAVAVGEWIDGEIVRGYFGPGKNWGFQGNFNVSPYKVESNN